MNVCMMTNTYLPHVGGVARSVSTFAETYRRLGHRVLVVAPEPPRERRGRPEAGVVRVAAVQHFNGSDFAVRLPLAASLSAQLDAFPADIVHAHHPFLLGDTALRFARRRRLPVVFTHHTRYEDYVHYVPLESPALRRAAIELSTTFANLCDGVLAPSESIARLIRRRGVKVPVAVVPTGIDAAAFAAGDGARGRTQLGLPARAFVIGHVGRLAAEKNLAYLARAVAAALRRHPDAWFLLVGSGPAEAEVRAIFDQAGVGARLRLAGSLTGVRLREAYRAMNVFAFSSLSETQGLVITEAMAAGLPVVALRGPGVREVVHPGVNGFLLATRSPEREFTARLIECASQRELARRLGRAAIRTAAAFTRELCAERALAFYEEIRRSTRRRRLFTQQSPWLALQERIGVEWQLLARNARAVATVLPS